MQEDMVWFRGALKNSVEFSSFAEKLRKKDRKYTVGEACINPQIAYRVLRGLDEAQLSFTKLF